MLTYKEITDVILGSGIEVHRALGPGLLESAYARCLCHELALRNVSYVCERHLPVEYKGLQLDCGYRLDLLVMDRVVVEVNLSKALHRFMKRSFLPICGLAAGNLV